MGEISVLMIALLGAISLLMIHTGAADTPYRFNHKKMDPSPILKVIAPYVAIFMNILALYIFFKGHNEPGGGFIAGVASSLSLVLLTLIFGPSKLKRMIRIDPIRIAISGLILAYVTCGSPVFFGHPFLKHYGFDLHVPILGHLHIMTSMLFDLGVFLVVLGVVTKVVLLFSHFAESRITYVEDAAVVEFEPAEIQVEGPACS